MDIILFKVILFSSLGLFLIPKKWKWSINFCLQIVLAGVTSYWAVCAFSEPASLKINFMVILNHDIYIIIDKLSAYFIFIINFTSLTALIYARDYLKPYSAKKNNTELSIHFFSFLWLHISMLLVVMLRDALTFLIIWEIMSISSFFLVIFESEKKETMKTGIKYLIMMHIGVVFLMFGFIWTYVITGAELSFDGLSDYFASHNPLPIFIVFFIGFGIKAGFIPLHSWLPHAHPAAPSHVSGIMSGVMIKMGIYGILRILTYIHHDLYGIGLFILIISLVTGLIGVTLAIVQHNVKKLLAYHSIENIGIIGIGIGLGVIGLAINIPILAVLGFAGGLLHILNHSLFKSLLFYTAGSVYQQTHTQNIELLGGLIKKMPKTALFFLLGALAICGLPPFNGFISEFFIYSGMFGSLHDASLINDVVLLFSLSGLVIIGGLAIFCFTKVFSIIFLGNPRSENVNHATEVGGAIILSDTLISIMIIFIGLMPIALVQPLKSVVGIFTEDTNAIQQIMPIFKNISITSGIFILLIGLICLLRIWQQKKHGIKQASTWACGYTLADPARHQYTATSYADNFRQLSNQIVNIKKEFREFDEEEIFPAERTFHTHSSDIIEDYLITKPEKSILKTLEKIAVFQTGKIQHYLLYALSFIVFIYILTLLNWI